MVRTRTAALLLSLLCAGVCPVGLPAGAQPPQPDESHFDSGAQPPTDAELRERSEKLIANQHADDQALDLYERIERYIDRSGGSSARVLDDRTYRVVPTGGGTMKILLRNDGMIVNADDYRRQLQAWRDVLEMTSTPGNSRGAAALAKYQKRARQRTEFVDAAKNAFLPNWLGRETYAGRSCDVFELDPNPQFHPASIFESALAHVTAKIWLDRDTNQLVRAEAWVTSDISFVAGIAGKVYRGSKVEMDQAEVGPGVWLPTHYEYDFTGRKFLFPFSEHQTIDVTHYQRVGTPPEALAEVKSELAGGKGPVADP
jgi:hypothetical protein